MDVLLLAVVLLVLAGVSALACSRSPRWATILGAGGAVAGCLLGWAATLRAWVGGMPESLQFSWDAPHGTFCVGMDPLSAFFLLPVLGLSALAAVYGGDYLLASCRERAIGSAWIFFNLFVAGMVMVAIARTALLFLVAWEVMSVAAYCLVVFEHEKPEVRRAGWVYLVATHLGVAFLFLAFVLLGRHAGNLEFERFRAMSPLGADGAGLIFALALIGFGAKAGFVPFHVWLPEAHPAAPSHVSALMSGVMIKMGLYGLLRVLTFLGPPAPGWGLALAGVGLVTGLLGISLALSQRDVKRVLAYSSIENIGLIALGLGVGLWGSASHRPAVAALGTTAALLQIWNHALMKGLMFFAAGGVLHGTGTKDMEKLGGLMKRMPWTASAMTVGAVAIASLPPLNGFAGKWLIYLGLLNCGLTSSNLGLTALLAVGLLTLIGGLAAITFVRLTGIILLGSPRSEASQHAHEASGWMLGPIGVLVLLCLVAAVVPHVVAVWTFDVSDQTLGRNSGQTALDWSALESPLDAVGVLNAWTLVSIGTMALVFRVLSRKRAQVEGHTWGCGYIQPTERMQYTGRSFAQMITETVVPRFLRPQATRQAPQGLFPVRSGFGSESPDPFSRNVYEPFFRQWAERFSTLRILQQGKIHVYLVYIAFVVVFALAWVSLRAGGEAP